MITILKAQYIFLLQGGFCNRFIQIYKDLEIKAIDKEKLKTLR